ncbi:hypothetical protein KJN74_06050, partial [Candidatus Bathyarchaeota archaeon]|nr:hypothetical protein [Candidatus Bathyarchaeota archaeon]
MLNKKLKAIIISTLLVLSTLSFSAAFLVKGQDTLFTITLTTPSTNPSRQAWAEVIQGELPAVGIDAQRVIQDWGTIY